MSTSTVYVAAIATFSIITATYTNLAINISFTRDQGVLKRIKGSRSRTRTPHLPS